ncbi:MAG: response regulator transcription factor [Lachnospiraceae bacterium]|nr:response regulator transcription factor [Lachnospiraceae bacterium]
MNNNRYKILVIEDESNIRSFAKAILEANQYQVITSDTCQNGIMMFSSHRPDLVLLDLGLPDRDGLEFIRTIRSLQEATPILVLSARTGETDKVEALDLGANDYITKPFGTAELLARVRVALRVSQYSGNPSLSLDGKFFLHDLMIDYDRRIVSISGNEIKLTQTEYNILVLLAKHTGKVLTYAFIIREVWGPSDDGGVKKLQVNMANLRKKMGIKPGDNRYIINELGVGYRMCEE